MATEANDDGNKLAAGEWTVAEARGRTESGEKGLSALHEVELVSGDRRVRLRQPPPLLNGTFRLVCEARGYRRFDACPICGADEPESKEHVPPKQLGGHVLTATCLRCNNEFGSKYESALVDWWDGALTNVSISHPNFPGYRRIPRVLLRYTTDNDLAIVFDEPISNDAIGRLFEREGSFSLTYSVPPEGAVTMAALKSAYLASCLIAGVLDTPESVAIRSLLVQARDSRRGDVPKIAAPPAILRLARDPEPGRVALLYFEGSPQLSPRFYISLAGTLLVQWPAGGHMVIGAPGGEGVVLDLNGGTIVKATIPA